VAVEIDGGLAKVLKEVTRTFSNVEVVVADAASCDYRQFEIDPSDKTVVSGNLPFNRSTEIYFKLLDEIPQARQMVLMFQREVAQRLTASPGSRTFGAPTVTSAVKAEVKTCFHVKPGSFHPRPQVQATVLKVVPRRPPLLDPCCLVHLRRLTRVAFGQRRKTIRNALKAGGLSYLLAETDDNAMKEAVSDLRPEALSVDQYVLMARVMCQQSGRCHDKKL
jgi:16S rRNA (adenine1518-N6/adenine1519-N6)-dimethyltransferase